MTLMDILLKRRSVRKYTGEDIPAETLEKILQAGLLAPTSRNFKPCEFYVVKGKEMLENLSKVKSMGGAMLAGCNAAIIVCADSTKADTWVEDSSIALYGMMLMAEEQGVGNCWVQIHLRADASGKDAEENVRELLSVPEKYRVVGILSLGMSAEAKKAHSIDDLDWKKVHGV